MVLVLAQELLSASAALWRAADAAASLLPVLAGIASAWLQVAHPLPSVREQDAVLAIPLVL